MSTLNNSEDNTIFKISMNLMGACLISGIIIALVYYLTIDVVKQNSIEMSKISIKNLVTWADDFNPIKGKTGWFEAIQEGKIKAYIVPSESKGYGGTIKLLVAVNTDGTVLNFSILESKETPGLGDKAAKDPFHSQFAGKKLDNLNVVKAGGNKASISAISGATITSKAVTNGVKEAVEKVQEYLREGK